MALTHVIAYDISDDRRRAQRRRSSCRPTATASSEACSSAPSNRDRIAEIRTRVAEIINPETDSVYVFRQCAACWDAVGIHGQATVAGEPLYWAVL